MNQATTPEIEVDKIDVEEGFNARTHQTADALDRLSSSLDKEGVVQPLLVRAGENGRVTVIAGHRRLEAAKLAGLETVPVNYYEGDRPRQASLIENLHREDLDPIDAARGLKAIAEEFELATNKEIAEQVQMSTRWVSERLRLLNLPEGVQRHVAAGVVPVEAERLLRKVAEVSPGVAECVCVSAKRHNVKPGDFVRDFDQLLAVTAEGRFEQKLTMIDARRITVSKVISDPQERQELAERINAADRYLVSEDPQVRLDETEIDAVRAAGCLIEHRVDQGDFYSVAAYITDAELAADIVHRAVERIEKQAKKREEEEAAWRSRSSELTGTPEEQKEARKLEREKAKQDASEARRFNEDLGRNLIQRRGKGSQRQHSLARAKAIAAVVLADNRELPARGLRLVLSQLQEVEIKELKSGEQRQKVSYADVDQCRQFLANRIEEARTPNEVLEMLTDALIAGIVADPTEVAQSKRVSWWTGAEEQVKKLLGADIKAVKPRRGSSKK
jgi:ParB/RepB/Spo0J family partition protein